MSRVRERLQGKVRRMVERLRPQWPVIARLTTAAVIAYVIAKAVTPDLTDLTGPLTALLVVQATTYRTLHSGIGRVGAVLTGVLVAIALSSLVGLTWWSLGIAIAAALSLAHAFKLGDHILETPISAMLILGVTQHDVAAETRLLNTLIGAAVGMLFNIALPPPVRTRSAQEAVAEVARSAAEAVTSAGEEIEDGRGLTRDRVQNWLEEVHLVLPRVSSAEAALAVAEDSRRLNPRAIGTADPTPVLRTGLVALDRCVLAVRQTLIALQESAPAHEEADDPTGEELRRAFSVVLIDMGACIDAYGRRVVAEADGREAEAAHALEETLDLLRETRAIVTELYFVDPAEEAATWLLRGSFLAGIEGILTELDVEHLTAVEEPAAWPDRLGQTRQAVNRLWLRRNATTQRPPEGGPPGAPGRAQ